ncbi:MAG: class I SAM-dependent methyltransferase [Mycobacteriales bacterium]
MPYASWPAGGAMQHASWPAGGAMQYASGPPGGAMQYASWLWLGAVPNVPELLAYQARDMHGLWQQVGTEAPPFWAFAWLGGQALARYVLDRPDVVRGRRVLDLATGSGIVALAAAHAGAAHVLAVDVDPLAGEAVSANAAANGLELEWCCEDLLDGPPPEVDLVLAADVLYDRAMAPRVLRWLRRSGADVLLSDPGRDYCPAHELTEVASYVLPADLELEGMRERRTRIFTL